MSGSTLFAPASAAADTKFATLLTLDRDCKNRVMLALSSEQEIQKMGPFNESILLSNGTNQLKLISDKTMCSIERLSQANFAYSKLLVIPIDIVSPRELADITTMLTSKADFVRCKDVLFLNLNMGEHAADNTASAEALEKAGYTVNQLSTTAEASEFSKIADVAFPTKPTASAGAASAAAL